MGGRPSSFPSKPSTCCVARQTGKERMITHQQGRDVQKSVAPGRSSGVLGRATLDCLLLSSVLASSLTSCQPASHGWRLLPLGQLELRLRDAWLGPPACPLWHSSTCLGACPPNCFLEATWPRPTTVLLCGAPGGHLGLRLLYWPHGLCLNFRLSGRLSLATGRRPLPAGRHCTPLSPPPRRP